MEVVLYTDGGTCKTNPGPMAYGFVGMHPECSHRLFEGCGMVGAMGTNNEAEYHALIEALKKAHELGFKRVQVRLDSDLVCNQMQGLYGCKVDNLRRLLRVARSWAKVFDSITFEHVKRAKNKRADELANMAIKLFIHQTEA